MFPFEASFIWTDFVQIAFHLELSSVSFRPKMWLLVLRIPGTCSGIQLCKSDLFLILTRSCMTEPSKHFWIQARSKHAFIWFWITRSARFQRKHSASDVWRFSGPSALDYSTCQHNHIALQICEAGNEIKGKLSVHSLLCLRAIFLLQWVLSPFPKLSRERQALK